MSKTRYRRLLATTVAAAACVSVLGVQTAAADASGNASCFGLEASATSPPGSSDEFPGGMSQFVSFLRGAGGPPGALIGPFAQVHAGSHEACDEASG